MLKRIALALLMGCVSLMADVPAERMGLLIKQFAAVHGQPGKATVKDSAVAAAAKAAGVELTPDAVIVFCTTQAEVKSWAAKKGHVVVVPKLDLMPFGACLAVVEENNLAKVYVRPDNYTEAGIKLPEFMKKLGTPVK